LPKDYGGENLSIDELTCELSIISFKHIWL
jgi:hypothetical protein